MIHYKKELLEFLKELFEEYSIRNDYGASYDNYYVEYDSTEKANEQYDIPVQAKKFYDLLINGDMEE